MNLKYSFMHTIWNQNVEDDKSHTMIMECTFLFNYILGSGNSAGL